MDYRFGLQQDTVMAVVLRVDLWDIGPYELHFRWVRSLVYDLSYDVSWLGMLWLTLVSLISGN